MTPTLRRQWLAQLGWSHRELAARVRRDEATVRRWLADLSEPRPDLDAWLERRAAAMAADPPPPMVNRRKQA